MTSNNICKPLEDEEWGMLSTSIQAGEYAFFVASGLSVTAGLPTGTELAKRMIEKLYPRIQDEGEAVTAFRKRFKHQGDLDLPVVTEFMEKAYGREKLIRYLISCTKWNLEPAPIHDFFRLLALKMEPSGKALRIITTNYDELLERSLPSSREVIVTNEQYRGVREDEPWVLKVHGCIKTQPSNTIRVTTTDLKKRLEDWKRTAIQSILALRGLIVIGYGATDMQVKRILVSAIQQTVRETYWVSLGDPPAEVLAALNTKNGKFLKIDAMTFFDNLGMAENNQLQ